MITYEQRDAQTFNVFLSKKLIGRIVESKKGFRYRPLGSDRAGEFFTTLQACKNSLEEE